MAYGMKIVIYETGTEYTKLKNLVFNPQVDGFGDSLPINEFSAEVITTDDISAGLMVELRDAAHDDALYARYWLFYAERVGDNVVKIVAKDAVAILDKINLEEAMYDNATLREALEDTMLYNAGEDTGLKVLMPFTIATTALDYVTGYFPAQTARERLQAICFATDHIVRTAFVEQITLDVPDVVAIPPSIRFWRPQKTYRDYVSAIKLTTYDYYGDYETDPPTWDVITQKHRRDNPNMPSGLPDNVVEIDDLQYINQGNVDFVLDRLAWKYFNREEITLDVINSDDYFRPGELRPGDTTVWIEDDGSKKEGFIESLSYRFGREAIRTTVKIVCLKDTP